VIPRDFQFAAELWSATNNAQALARSAIIVLFDNVKGSLVEREKQLARTNDVVK
jgi:hypothetical protein